MCKWGICRCADLQMCKNLLDAFYVDGIGFNGVNGLTELVAGNNK